VAAGQRNRIVYRTADRRRIFDLYLKGFSLRRINTELCWHRFGSAGESIMPC
jgi:hypothetical protein